MNKISHEHVPLVTVGIPVYNGAKQIRYAIESVLRQTFTDFELIITDDASTDESLNIIKSFRDERISIVSMNKNHGIAYCLNQQILIAKGLYYVRMDADDIMMPDRLMRQIAFFTEHEDADVVGSTAVIIDENYNIVGRRGSANTCRHSSSSVATHLFMHPTVMGKISWFRDHPYDERLCGYEDYDLWSRTAHCSVFYNIGEPLLFYQDKMIYSVKPAIKLKIKGIKVYVRELIDGVHPLHAFYKMLWNSFAIPGIILIHLLHFDQYFICLRNHHLDKEDATKYQIKLNEFRKMVLS